TEARPTHRKRPQFYVDILMRRERGHARAPLDENFIDATRIGAAEDRAAEMIQDDRRVRELRREIGHLAQLRMVNPRVEGEAEACEALVSLAELRLSEHLRKRNGFVNALIRIPRG